MKYISLILLIIALLLSSCSYSPSIGGSDIFSSAGEENSQAASNASSLDSSSTSSESNILNPNDDKNNGDKEESGPLILWKQNLDAWNPLLSLNQQESSMNFLVYEALYGLDSNFKAYKMLVSDHKVSKDGRIHYLKIKDNIYFSNGKKLDSKGVINNILYIQNIEESPYHRNLAEVTKLESVDKLNLIITLKDTDMFFPEKLTFPLVYFSDDSLDDLKEKNFKLIDEIISEGSFLPGTGPYMYAGRKEDLIELKLNTKYSGHGTYKIEDIHIRKFENSMKAMELLQAGEVDMVYLNDDYYQTYYLRHDLNTHSFPGKSFVFFQLNLMEDSLLKDYNYKNFFKELLDDSKLDKDLTDKLFSSREELYFIPDEGVNPVRTYGQEELTLVTEFNKRKSPIRLIAQKPDKVEALILNVLSRKFDTLGLEYELIILEEKDFQKAIIDGKYDIALRSALIQNPWNFNWLFIHDKSNPYVNYETLEASDEEAYLEKLNEALGSIGELNKSIGIVINEEGANSTRPLYLNEEILKLYSDIIIDLYKESAYVGLGYKNNGVVLGKRVRGVLWPDYFNPFNRVEDLITWRGY